MMYKILSRVITTVTLMYIPFTLSAVNLLDTDMVWEYYDWYVNPSERIEGRIKLWRYSLHPFSGDEDTRVLLTFDSSREWLRDQYDGNIWYYQGEETPSEPAVKLSQRGNKVIMSLTPEYIECHGLYEYDGESGSLIEVNPEKDMEIILYNFDAEVGDRYPTIIFGNVLTTATVVEKSYRDDIMNGVGEVRIITDFSLQYHSIDYIPGEAWDEGKNIYTICYLEKIGNISNGTYTSLDPLWYLGTGMIYFHTEINNVYDSQGSIVYKGADFDGFASINDKVSVSVSEGPIYDLHGREVSSPVSGSIYIRNGKKFVAE